MDISGSEFDLMGNKGYTPEKTSRETDCSVNSEGFQGRIPKCDTQGSVTFEKIHVSLNEI